MLFHQLLLEKFIDVADIIAVDDIFKCYKFEGISATRQVRLAKMNKSRQPDNSGGTGFIKDE